MKYNNIYILYKINILVFLIIVNCLVKKNVNVSEKLKMKFDISREIINIYSMLYDSARDGKNIPKYNNINENIYNISKKNGIAICSIGKNENLYIREFVEYYNLLGVKKIIIYDNNDIDGEKFDEVILDYILNKYVDIIDVRGLTSIQIPIYNYCYQKNKDLYDWIGLLDIDEYIYIKNKSSINDFLYDKKFSKCELIHINWLIYNDNNNINYENKPLNIRFKNPTRFFYQGKSFVRGGFKNLLIPSTHIPGINIHYYCNSNGERIYPKNFISAKIEKDHRAYIKHYYTKTIEEFCTKINKGHAHYNKNHPNYIRSIKGRIKLFFKFNKITNTKIKILENCIGINLNRFKNNKKNLLD